MSIINTNPDAKKYTYAVYVLQALFFLWPVTPIIGVIINYIKDEDVKGTWLKSHFEWQKNTFWYGLLWTVLGTLTTILLFGYFVLIFAAIWLIYRIAKGWIYLVDGKELYTLE